MRSFSTYKRENFGVIKIKYYGKSKVVGVGDVKVETNLGHNLILKNIFHIPYLRMNLTQLVIWMIEVVHKNLRSIGALQK